ncbi:ninjurin-1 isoform X2 [Nerophis ophidion]|uniref:ninjurin-1 isoform X2 n=1 Tax=Nerophis ophidion TaxID=159077 RepID=UPI002AE032E8|nr:ninjurin-1 isoform X2 [Nerophis ophidion]
MAMDGLEMNGDADHNGDTEVPLRGPTRQRTRPLNMNHYANKKSMAESMLDVALLMANASQLKAVMEQGPSFSFYVPLIVLISVSLILQILVGILLIFIGKTCFIRDPGTKQGFVSGMPLKDGDD